MNSSLKPAEPFDNLDPRSTHRVFKGPPPLAHASASTADEPRPSLKPPRPAIFGNLDTSHHRNGPSESSRDLQAYNGQAPPQRRGIQHRGRRAREAEAEAGAEGRAAAGVPSVPAQLRVPRRDEAPVDGAVRGAPVGQGHLEPRAAGQEEEEGQASLSRGVRRRGGGGARARPGGAEVLGPRHRPQLPAVQLRRRAQGDGRAVQGGVRRIGEEEEQRVLSRRVQVQRRREASSQREMGGPDRPRVGQQVPLPGHLRNAGGGGRGVRHRGDRAPRSERRHELRHQPLRNLAPASPPARSRRAGRPRRHRATKRPDGARSHHRRSRRNRGGRGCGLSRGRPSPAPGPYRRFLHRAGSRRPGDDARPAAAAALAEIRGDHGAGFRRGVGDDDREQRVQLAVAVGVHVVVRTIVAVAAFTEAAAGTVVVGGGSVRLPRRRADVLRVRRRWNRLRLRGGRHVPLRRFGRVRRAHVPVRPGRVCIGEDVG